jgi:hypothetical protein
MTGLQLPRRTAWPQVFVNHTAQIAPSRTNLFEAVGTSHVLRKPFDLTIADIFNANIFGCDPHHSLVIALAAW